LPTANGVRLLGVTVSNFDQMLINAADELLPLFGTCTSVAPKSDECR
jgi:hypothetical protein